MIGPVNAGGICYLVAFIVIAIIAQVIINNSKE